MSSERVYREDYFIYKGVAYGIGTTVLFNENITQTMLPMYRDKPHKFTQGFTDGWKRFQWYDPNLKPIHVSEPCGIIPDRDIKEIVTPVYIELVPVWKNALNNAVSGKKDADIGGGIFLYVIAMIGGLIFKEWYLIWFAATAILIGWLINKFRD